MSNDGLGLGFSYGVTGDFSIFKSQNYWFATELSISTIPVHMKSNTELRNVVPLAPINGIPRDTTYKYSGGDVNFKYNTQYIQIPLSIKMKTEEIGNLKYFFQFGLAPSFRMKSRLTTSVVNGSEIYPANKGISFHDPNSTSDDVYQFTGTKIAGSPSGEKEYDFKDDIASIRLPLIMGAGFEYKMSGSTTFVAGLRFDNAINNFFKEDPKVSGRSNMIGIQAGIIF